MLFRSKKTIVKKVVKPRARKAAEEKKEKNKNVWASQNVVELPIGDVFDEHSLFMCVCVVFVFLFALFSL